jgi:hypothetical protein
LALKRFFVFPDAEENEESSEKSQTHHQVLRRHSLRQPRLDDGVHEDDLGKLDGEVVLVAVNEKRVSPVKGRTREGERRERERGEGEERGCERRQKRTSPPPAEHSA